MRIVLAGGSGFLGRALAGSLSASSHAIVVLTRQPAAARPNGARHVQWTPDGSNGAWSSAINGADVVVNLAGESIAGARWSPAQKQRIGTSRLNATRSLVAAIGSVAAPPPLFISGSAVGYYGPNGDEILTEESAPGSDFLAGVCVEWEREARKAASERTRVACIRTGLVLSKGGGALPQMLLPFRLFAGGPVGSGRQYWPWIHVTDWVELVRWVIRQPGISGAVNATAPNPVPNAEFAHALGRAMHRPALLPAPAFALRLLLGEMADGLLLSGQRALPTKAQRHGYTFRFERVDGALKDIFDGPQI
jgi:uncharacterized protein (TIGR01777 family)